jgi:hypothetical protein
MGSTGALMAIILLAGFLGGVTIGVIVIVSAASRHEDRNYSLDRDAPNAACRGARRFNRVWVLGHAVKPAGYQPIPATEDRNARREEVRR